MTTTRRAAVVAALLLIVAAAGFLFLLRGSDTPVDFLTTTTATTTGTDTTATTTAVPTGTVTEPDQPATTTGTVTATTLADPTGTVTETDEPATTTGVTVPTPSEPDEWWTYNPELEWPVTDRDRLAIEAVYPSGMIEDAVQVAQQVEAFWAWYMTWGHPQGATLDLHQPDHREMAGGRRCRPAHVHTSSVLAAAAARLAGRVEPRIRAGTVPAAEQAHLPGLPRRFE